MAQKFNWGAALTTLGGGIGDYAETKRREMAMKMLRDQQVADLADRRAYDDEKWLERLNITDPLMPVPKDVREYVGMPETQVGPMPGMNLPQYERTSTVGNWQNMLPPAPRVSNRAPAPEPEQFVVIGTDGQQQVFSAPAGRVPSAVAALETPDYSPLPAGTDESGRPVFRLNRNYERPLPTGGGAGRASGPKPLDMTRSADALTEAALGPAVEKTTAAGNVYDFSMGGTQAAGPDLQALANPELRRGFWQAARDSSATGRWPIDAPSEVLASKIFETVAPQYAEMAIPGGWEFRPGNPNTTADDQFVGVDMGIGKFDKKKKPLDFFKEYIVPKVNAAKDEGLGWQALVNSAKKYGLNPDDLKPLLDQKRFQQFFGAAQAAAIEDDINEVFR